MAWLAGAHPLILHGPSMHLPNAACQILAGSQTGLFGGLQRAVALTKHVLSGEPLQEVVYSCAFPCS